MKIANRTNRFLALSLATGVVLAGGTFAQASTNPVAQATTLQVTSAATNSVPATQSATAAPGTKDIRNARYCEVLPVVLTKGKLIASVYNTLGLNDCPDAAWKAMDVTAIKKQFGAFQVELNGPRYFMMNQIIPKGATASGEKVTIGGLEFTKRAEVELTLAGMKSEPYVTRDINRDTTYVFKKGLATFQLVGPDGSVYVMQSYAQTVNPKLTIDDLPKLGDMLKLPTGWKFQVVKPDEDLVLTANGVAHLIQDDLNNSYQRIEASDLAATTPAMPTAAATMAPTAASIASAALAAAQVKNDAFRTSHQTAHDAIDAAFTHKYVAAGGVNWHYVEAGKVDGLTVLLLHGLPESWYSWNKVLPLLDPTFHYIVPDMKGYGRSTSTDLNYNWHHVGDQTLALMDAIGVGKFYIVGHDWGALISSVMVADHPDRFLGYIRMEADLKYTPGTSLDQLYTQKPQWKLFQNYNVAVTFLSNAESVIDTVYPTRMVTKLDPVDRDYFVFEFSRPGVAKAVANYFQFANWDLESGVTKIANNKFNFPVLQLQADSDPSQPKTDFTDVSTLFPNVKFQWITNANHFDNLDQPTQVADAINHFCKQA
jgi:pimeloyl-ACP methyl ester carboxylesterase